MKKTTLLFAAALCMAQASFGAVITYTVSLNGASEATPNASAGTGSATAIIDDSANTLTLNLIYSGLTGTATASHIHCCTTTAGTGASGIAVPFAITTGATSGTYSATLDLALTSTYNSTFLSNNGGTASGAEAALLAGIAAGDAYWNVHSTSYSGGEIRGFLAPAPEPATIFLTAGALFALGIRKYRRNKA